MAERIILLSGPVAAGKSRLARALRDRFGYTHVITRDLIVLARPRTALTRGALQAAGDRLDSETAGKWVSAEVARLSVELPDDAVIVVDSVRTLDQVESFRQGFGSRVSHVHLTASDEYLRNRFSLRQLSPAEFASYDQVIRNRTERRVGRLAEVADIVVDSSRSSETDVVVRVASHLGLYGRSIESLVDVIVGGQYGSEGKGNIAAFLAPEYQCLIRVGGPNAGHTVYQEPRKYVFHQLPSGTLNAPTAALILGPGTVISVPTLLTEIADHEVTPERLSIDPQAMVVSAADIEFEGTTLVGSIGSTGQGVGSATSRRVLRGAHQDGVQLARDVEVLQPFLRQTREVLERSYAQQQRILLEGTQGTGLSIYHGHYPKVTSRDTTVSGCLSEAGIPPSRVRRILMVSRTYPIRVKNPAGGDSGFMSQEISWDEVARRSGYSAAELRSAEIGSTTRRLRRVGEFDWELLRHASSLNGPTDNALTFVDYLDNRNRASRRVEQLDSQSIQMIAEIEKVSGAPVSLISVGPQPRHIIDLRTW